MSTEAWYVLRVETGSEQKICDLLNGWDGFSAFNPKRIERREVRRGRRNAAGERPTYSVYCNRSLWPSYLFAAWPYNDAHAWQRAVGEWSAARLLGVFGVLGGGEFPDVIPTRVVDGWVARANREGVIVDLDKKLAALKRGYGEGDPVRLIGGQWDGKTGTCQSVDPSGTRVQLSLFNREVSVYIPMVGCGVRVVGGDSPANVRTKSRRRRRQVLRAERSVARQIAA
jgi:transcription antitermination factor NusG